MQWFTLGSSLQWLRILSPRADNTMVERKSALLLCHCRNTVVQWLAVQWLATPIFSTEFKPPPTHPLPIRLPAHPRSLTAPKTTAPCKPRGRATTPYRTHNVVGAAKQNKTMAVHIAKTKKSLEEL